jgi:hypothetical protein
MRAVFWPALLMANHHPPCIFLMEEYRDALGQRLHSSYAQGRQVPRTHLPPQEAQDAPVVICSELPNNGGTSVTYAAEQLAAEVIRSHRLPTPLVGWAPTP